MSHNSGVPDKKVFISYSHADKDWLRRLKTHLTPLIRGSEIVLWDDTKIQPGNKWKDEIGKALAEASGAVLLVTQEFLASEFIHKHELPAIYEAARSRGLRFLWIIPVKASSVASTPVWDYQALHDPKKPLESLKGDARTKALVEIAESIANTINGPARQDNPESYLKWLWGKTQLIDLEHFKPPDSDARQFFIDRLYTKLTTVIVGDRQDRLPGLEKHAKAGDRYLHEALKDHRLLVLVGDPGAGKTTFLRRIAFELCHVRLGLNKAKGDKRCRRIERLLDSGEDTLAVLVDAKTLASHIWSGGVAHSGALADETSPQWLFHYLGATHAGCGLSAGYFAAEAERGSILLVDAFDEVPDEYHREKIGQLLKSLAEDPRYENTRIVGTSRPGEHGGLTSIKRFETARVAPLGDKEKAIFVKNWGHAVYRDSPEDAAAFSKTLSNEIQRPQVRILAKNPMMLTALAVLHFAEKKKLPEQRSELYKYILEWLAKSRASRKRDGGTWQAFLFKMRLLAMRMSTGTDEMRAEIGRDEAVDVLEDDFRESGDRERRRETARTFLLEEETKSGVIIQSGSNVRFWHLTFREALTAQELVKDRKWRAQLFEKNNVYKGLWRETILLLAGELMSSGSNPDVDAFLDEMLARAEAPDAGLADRAHCVGLMGALLRDLDAWKYFMTEELSSRHKPMRAQVEEIFDAKKAYDIPFAVRLDAANALGLAGDPRLDRDNFVRLEGGTFWMGAQKEDSALPNFDEEAFEDEAPVGEETVGPFLIGRYLVTVTEYEGFMQDGADTRTRNAGRPEASASSPSRTNGRRNSMSR